MSGLWKRYQMILTYFSHSVLSTLLDVVIVWLLLNYAQMDITWANTCGVVAGFVLGFLLDVKRTFNKEYTPLTFMVYFGTFLLGLALADVLITVTYGALEGYLPRAWSFLISKGVSVVVPFFFLYGVRKFAYQKIRKKNPDE